MKITIESTDKIVAVVAGELRERTIECRVWEGMTESGIEVVCLIPRIAVKMGPDGNLTEFDRELKGCRPPTAISDAFPLKMIL